MEWFMENVQPHWPFALVLAVLWLIGHFMEKSVFTQERLLRYHPNLVKDRSAGQKLHHWFFYWMRESMELHSTIAGTCIGLVWHNPEGADPAWHWVGDVGYFMGAGILSLFGWLIIVKGLGRLGINASDLTLPGESSPPPPKIGTGE